MDLRTWLVISVLALTITSCRTMELANKTIQINKGDDRANVLQIMGTPQDRQFLGDYEVLQYCITGAGFGYHDYSAIWLHSGEVVGITSYKDDTPASSCRGHFRSFRVEDAPGPGTVNGMNKGKLTAPNPTAPADRKAPLRPLSSEALGDKSQMSGSLDV
jgi:hypothetical protein